MIVYWLKFVPAVHTSHSALNALAEKVGMKLIGEEYGNPNVSFKRISNCGINYLLVSAASELDLKTARGVFLNHLPSDTHWCEQSGVANVSTPEEHGLRPLAQLSLEEMGSGCSSVEAVASS